VDAGSPQDIDEIMFLQLSANAYRKEKETNRETQIVLSI
jgi:hypothetical protein